ncbi:MAG TPA: presenilin family intramembrane aspartyl protease PSH [Candidatus Thermoplasmatota archaeon]|nr:presenilin family intramembrane aspartyl protease PSH [Candidatus Thermoplasmatota archaeon]
MDEASKPVEPTPLTVPEPPLMPVTMAEYRGTAVLLAFFVATMLLAVLFAAPFKTAGLQAFSDPQDVGNSVWYVLLILVFTFIILYIARKGAKWLIRLIILGTVALTIAYVAYPLLAVSLGLPATGAYLGAALIAAGFVLALYLHPEWYVVDAVGLVVAAGSAAIFGISLGLVPVFVLLALLAIYDAIAVYRTRHMLSLADTVIELRLPVLLVIPKHGHYRFRDEAARFKQASTGTKGEREAMFMGLGDLVMPTILVVSALQFGEPAWGPFPSLGAALGTLVGFGVLMGFVLKGRPQAGLPLLNGGALVGFLAGVYFTTRSIVFW